MRILLIEDEENAALRLENLVRKIKPNVEILSVLDSIESSVQWFLSNPQPELVFMDIQLADGSSFNIFEKVKVDCPVIFTTAFDEFAIKAFEVNSIDYLLKPINEEKLIKSLDKLINLTNKFAQSNLQIETQSILQNLKTTGKTYRSRFLIQKTDSYDVIPIEKVAWFMAEHKEVLLVTADNKKHFINFSLDRLEKELNPSKFFRVNRQYLVSLSAISKINNYFNYKLKVELIPSAKKEVIVGRRKVGGFKSWLDESY